MTSPCREILLVSSPADNDNSITAYDPLSGDTLAHFSGCQSPVSGLSLAGRSLIASTHFSSSTATGSILLYNWWSSAPSLSLPAPEPVAPLAATFSGNFLFSGGLSGQIHAHSLNSRKLVRSFPVHQKPVSALAVTADDSLLISGSDDGMLAVFPLLRLLDESGQNSDQFLPLHLFLAHSLPITGVIVSGGCYSTAVSCSLDCTLKIWSVIEGTHLRTVKIPCPVWCVAVDPAETVIYAGGSDGRVYSGSLKVGRRRHLGNDAGDAVTALPEEHSGAVTALVVAREGRNLVSAAEDGEIRVWEMETKRVVRVLGNKRGGISGLVVARGVGSAAGIGGHVRSTDRNLGFSGREICRPVREAADMVECLDVVVKDRRRAVDTLEAAIGTYEKLLGLLLKEARGKEEGSSL